MRDAVKAEIRRLLTARSTYALVAAGLALTVLVAFYFEGYHLHGADLRDPNQLNNDVVSVLTSLPMVFGSIVAILLVTQEYRYNTILYTLTSTNRRFKILAAKFVVISLFAVLFTAVLAVMSPALSALGVHLHGNHLVRQVIPGSIVWRSLLYGWASLMVAFVIAVIVRSQVGAIVTLFAIPIAEALLTGLLHNTATAYFPIASSNEILTHSPYATLSYAHASIIFLIYIVIASIVASVLFARRDAN